MSLTTPEHFVRGNVVEINSNTHTHTHCLHRHFNAFSNHHRPTKNIVPFERFVVVFVIFSVLYVQSKSCHVHKSFAMTIPRQLWYGTIFVPIVSGMQSTRKIIKIYPTIYRNYLICTNCKTNQCAYAAVAATTEITESLGMTMDTQVHVRCYVNR